MAKNETLRTIYENSVYLNTFVKFLSLQLQIPQLPLCEFIHLLQGFYLLLFQFNIVSSFFFLNKSFSLAGEWCPCPSFQHSEGSSGLISEIEASYELVPRQALQQQRNPVLNKSFCLQVKFLLFKSDHEDVLQ